MITSTKYADNPPREVMTFLDGSSCYRVTTYAALAIRGGFQTQYPKPQPAMRPFSFPSVAPLRPNEYNLHSTRMNGDISFGS